ncbi:MAG: hypothetical protein WDN02_07450 [Methylovirgula sp.]|uniref:hypothetical protein n=1 Tax=Methylovirgula sp. TaxID=1978224 RepID=UPI003075EE61
MDGAIVKAMVCGDVKPAQARGIAALCSALSYSPVGAEAAANVDGDKNQNIN